MPSRRPAADAKLAEAEAERAAEVSRIMGSRLYGEPETDGWALDELGDLPCHRRDVGVAVMLFFFHVPLENIPLIAPAETTATFNFAFAAVIGFWIGSSRGSAEKQRTIDKALSE